MTSRSFPLIVTWSDLRVVARKYRRWIACAALCSALAGGVKALSTPAQFTAKALLREGASSSTPSGLSNLFLSAFAQNFDGSGIVMMQSDRVLRSAIEELGLQASVDRKGRIRSLLQCVYANILLLRGKEPIEQEPFRFSCVRYDSRKSLHFSLVFKDKNRFILQDKMGNLLAKGSLGERVLLPEASFSILQTPSDIAMEKPYNVEISPWECAAPVILASLEIRPEKLDRSLLKLFYSHPSRGEAARILDGVMTAYMRYLQEENNRVADEQLAHLDKRQAQFADKFDHELDEHLACMKQNISIHGFIEVKQQVQLLAESQQELNTRLIELDSMYNRLKKVQASYHYAMESDHSLGRDPLVQILPAVDVQLSSHFSPSRFGAAKGPSSREEQFAGIDLPTAEKLHVDYQREIDDCQEKSDRLSFLLSRIHRKDFDLNALGALVHDQVTGTLVSRASELALQIKDVANRSQKDILRIEESLAAQKTFIAQHLGQTLELYSQNGRITRSKLARLREVMMTLVEAEKAVIHNKLMEIRGQLGEIPARWKLERQLEVKSEAMRKITEGITQMFEGKTIERYLKQINSKIIDNAHCPLGATKTSILFLMAIFAGAGIAASYVFFFCRLILRGFPLSESTARALELATGGTVGPFCDAPLQQLSERDVDTIRSLANFIQREKQRVKQEKKKESEGIVVALAGEGRLGFIHNLARLLSMQGASVLIVDDVSQEETSTLSDYLTEKSPAWQTRKYDGFDILPSGAAGRFFPEHLHKERFAQLLINLRAEYDIVLFACSGVFAAKGGGRVFEKMDALIVTVQEESLDELANKGYLDRLATSTMIVFQECGASNA